MSAALAVLLLGLVLAGVSAAVGVAAATVSQHELTRWVAYKLRGSAATVGLLQNPQRTLATANTLTTLGVLLAAGGDPGAARRVDPDVSRRLYVCCRGPAFVTAAYLVPRVWPSLAGVARGAGRSVDGAVGAVLAPFIPRRERSSRATLAAVLSGDAIARGTDEMAVVSGVLAFSDRPVRELMTPRTAIVALPEGMPAGEAAHVVHQSGYSRYPVYRGSLDEVVGVAHAFDLLGLTLAPEAAPLRVHPVLSVPGTRRAADLMLEMQRGKSHLAVVLDEFGEPRDSSCSRICCATSSASCSSHPRRSPRLRA